jgi:regulator of protease activity HflC (stomatin/prohibitin superfamily)
MLGFKFVKVQPTEYVLLYRNGRLVKEGAGLSFFYFAPTSTLVSIPFASTEAPFIFKDVTADFQEITVQGQLTYSVSSPKKLSQLMNYSLLPNGRDYASDDPRKLPQRLINQAQVLTRSCLQKMSLRQALGSSDALENALRKGMKEAEEMLSLGVQVLGLSILAIRPTPETARALEAEAREQILREADEAVYARRNAAVEQERAIKENELNTEIAVEQKKRQIRETQMEAEKSVQQKKRELGEAEMAAKIALEEQNRAWVALAAENSKQEADAKAYGTAALMKSLASADPKLLQALASSNMSPGQLIALAFKDLAENADKIGHLNITPELLQDLLER